jgi:hypothetical protein
LDSTIDPNSKCVEDSNGFATLDADSDAAIPISLVVKTKGDYTDEDALLHPATVGTLSDKANSRYILSCPQTAGVKMIQLTVSRPKAFTEFGGEWVQMFPKDSWSNVTNEYEPFTFNNYGSKIPLATFRTTPDELSATPEIKDELNVYMEAKDEGDYEFKYGNPQLKSGGKWVAVEFKQTLLRVGSPYADCTGSTLGTETKTVGAILPVLFGGPNTATATKSLVPGQAEDYDVVIAELASVAVPVKVVLEIFTAGKTSYTDSAVDGVCYNAGNACPEAHSVCEASHCEIDVWKTLIANFKAASPGKITVLGSIDASTAMSAYDGLGVDGFYFTATPPASITGASVSAIGSPLFDATTVDAVDTYITLASDDIGIWNPFSWYPYVAPSKWAALVTGTTDLTVIDTLVDRGYGSVYLTDAADFSTFSTITANVLDKLEAVSTRRLQEADRRLTATAPFWGCDDTLFECVPICLKQDGPVTMRVADALCTTAPQDQCACKCYHEAQWTCEGEAVVCKAKYGEGELETVGDKVCETRSYDGALKPVSVAELKMASQCTPKKDLRGSSPTVQCLTEWKKVPTTAKPTVVATAAPATAPASLAVIEESFAAPLAVVALALFA